LLDGLLRFSNYLNADAYAEIRTAMAIYTRQVLRCEWPALGDGQKDKQTDELFSRFVNAVVQVKLSERMNASLSCLDFWISATYESSAAEAAHVASSKKAKLILDTRAMATNS
jgi:hypothetical protein